MTTIADLQVRVDSKQIDEATKSLNDFAKAANNANNARKPLAETSTPQADNDTKKITNLSEAIDSQTRKLAALEKQRKALNASPLKSEDPSEYARLNKELDARTELVKRQGNSLDKLGVQVEREQRQREQASKAEEASTNRQIKAIEQKNATEVRYTTQQQKNLEATISGLDRQVKAQLEYNKTVESLSLQRFQGNLSGPEFDTWVKKAQLKRDDSLATADNTKEVERNQRMLDSVTSTLGRVERAEVQYSRGVTVTNEALRLGNITQEQHSTLLSQLNTKREAAISAANGEEAAQSRLNQQIRNVLGAMNPVIAANDRYENSVKILKEALDSGQISIGQYISALNQQKKALDDIKNAQPDSSNSRAREYQATLDKLLPLNAQMRELEKQERTLIQAKAAGKVTTDEQIRDYERATAAIAAERAEITRRSQDMSRAGNSAKQDAAALRGLPAQFTDIVVSLQGGQAPLTVFLQQGGQIKDMFGGTVPALKAFSGALLAMITPLSVAGAGLALMGAAAYSGSQEITAFNRAVIQSGGVSGVSASQFVKFRDALSDAGFNAGKAAGVMTSLAQAGKVTSDLFVRVTETALLMQKATGQALSETVEDFNALGKDPVAAAVRLDEKYRFLTSSILAQADALVRTGKESEATTLLQTALSDQASKTAREMIEQAGYIEQAWDRVTKSISGAWDSLKNIGRSGAQSNAVELQLSKELMERSRARLKEGNLLAPGLSDEQINNNPAIKAIQAQIDKYQELVDADQAAAKATADAERTRQEGVTATTAALARQQSGLKGVDKAENDLKKVQLENEKIRAAGNVSAELEKIMTDNLAAANKDLAEAKEKAAKTKTTPVDNKQLVEAKNSLVLINNEYDNYFKKASELGSSGIISAEAAYRSQKAILNAQKEAITTAYNDQVEQIKKLRSVKANNVSQNIALDNQLTKAETDRSKAIENIAAKESKIDIERQGAMEKRTRGIKAYTDALSEQLATERRAGEAAALGVGLGDKDRELFSKLNSNDVQFDKDRKALANQLGEKSIDDGEYKEKLDALTKAHGEMTDQIIENDKKIKAAEGDWTNGLTRALKNYSDEGANYAKAMETAITGSFDSMSDSLATFVTTGKLDFRSLTTSILSDLAKIAVRLALSNAVGSLFGSFMGGGGSASGHSSGGFTTQAQGGGWSKGTQFFAQGGAFTNSVVSTPTAFGLSGGGLGVMGEAGPEAIVPLSRSADGSLGVRMMGGGQQTSSGVQVYISISPDGTTTESSSDATGYPEFGKEIGDFVERKYYQLQKRDLKDGGTIRSAMMSR